MIAILIVSDANSEASAVNVMLATNLAETWVSPAAMSGPDDTVLQLVKLCGGFVPLGQEFVALRGEFADFVQQLRGFGCVLLGHGVDLGLEFLLDGAEG